MKIPESIIYNLANIAVSLEKINQTLTDLKEVIATKVEQEDR